MNVKLLLQQQELSVRQLAAELEVPLKTVQDWVYRSVVPSPANQAKLDEVVVFVKPRPELGPFFRLNYEESTRKAFEGVTSTRVELYRTPYLKNPASAMGMVGVELLAA